MVWIGLLLLGLGVVDLVFSLTRGPRVSEAAGFGVVVGAAALAGVQGIAWLGVVGIALGVVVWGESVTVAFGRHRAGWALGVLSVLLVATLGASAFDTTTGGPLGDWLDATDLAIPRGMSPDRMLAVVGALLAQMSTGNVVVRLVLLATGTTNPQRTTRQQAPASLKGGRLLGPLERLFILGLGLAGEITAASLVIAAKGLLRFPELQAARTGPRRPGEPREPGIHAVTEYFLVGSFVSWTVALVSLLLVAG